MVDQEAVYAYLHEVGRHYAIKHPAWANDVGDWASRAFIKVRACFPLKETGWKSLCVIAFHSVRSDDIRRLLSRKTSVGIAKSAAPVDSHDGADANILAWQIMGGLPEPYQHVWLADVLGYEASEGADMIGITVAAYKSRLYRAREIAKKLLGPCATSESFAAYQ